MHPVYAKEDGRWSYIGRTKFADEFYSSFRVKFQTEGPIQDLTIKTTEDCRHGLSYSIGNGPYLSCETAPWIDPFLQAVNQSGEYTACEPKELELRTEGDELWYELTPDCKKQIWSKHNQFMSPFRDRFTANANIEVPNTAPGPRFQNTEHAKLVSPG